MKKLFVIFLNILFVSIYPQGLTLNSDNADTTKTDTMFGKYKLYIFADDSAKDKSGDLKILNKSGKTWDYEWFYFKENNYVQIPDANNVIKISGLATGYYKVQAIEQGNPSNQQTLVAYILNIARAQIAGIIQDERYKTDCDTIKLNCLLSKEFSRKVIKDFTDTSQHYTYNYALNYIWSSITTDRQNSNYSQNKKELIITGINIPRESASFIISIKDGINKEVLDSLSVPTIHVNPKYEIFDTTSTMYERNYNDGEPMVIKIRNISSTKANWKKFEWQFYVKDVLLEKISKNLEQTNEDNANENFAVTIKRAGTNIIKLISTSQLGCIDSSTVFSKQLNNKNYFIPDAFTPSKTENNIFKLSTGSNSSVTGIISFDGRIFNRWGQELYRWSNPDDGWDGTINGREASSGTYYYRFIIVSVTNREDKTGPLLLIR